MLIFKKIAGYLRHIKKLFTKDTIPETFESSQAKQNSELELDKYKREASVINERISRRI